VISILDPHLQAYFAKEKNPFEKIMQMRGEIYRELEGRRTQRVEINGKYYFIKQHFGIGWKEVFKNLFQLRLPVMSAKNEWLAIQRLQELNIATPKLAAFGCEGCDPAQLKSFIITAELPPSISLEDYCKEWPASPPSFAFKKTLIEKVASIARTLHTNGVNHRDFYICHFLMDLAKKDKKLFLIDLHRAQIRKHVPTRWVIKDLAGLYFSSKDIGLSQRDLLRFMKVYCACPLRSVLKQEGNFWQKVKQRGDQLYQKHDKT
jgi:heptose I phosphotransferase